MLTMKSLFLENALKLKEGECITLPCMNKKDQKSKACGLRNVRNGLKGKGDYIEIIPVETDDKFYVVLRYSPDNHDLTPILIKADGSSEYILSATKEERIEEKVARLKTEHEEEEQAQFIKDNTGESLEVWRRRKDEEMKHNKWMESMGYTDDTKVKERENEKRESDIREGLILDNSPLTDEEEQEALERQEEDVDEFKQAMQDIHRNVKN